MMSTEIRKIAGPNELEVQWKQTQNEEKNNDCQTEHT